MKCTHILIFLSLLTLTTASIETTVTVQSINTAIEEYIMNVGVFVDSVGSYFNICRPPITQAVSDASGQVIGQLKNLNVGAATDTITNVASHICDDSLPYAPVTTFFTNYMRETKAVLATISLIITCIAIKRLFFTKDQKKKHAASDD